MKQRTIIIGDKPITAKIAKQLMPSASIATQETDAILRSETFSQGHECALLGGKEEDCPWAIGVVANWWKEGFAFGRISVIGQNGATGEHYEEDSNQ